VPARLAGVEIVLRPLTPADAPVFAKWAEDPALLRTNTAVRAMTEARSSRDYSRFAGEPASVTLGVCLKDGRSLIGVVGLHDIDWRGRSARFEIFVGGDGQISGKGFRTDAARTLVDYGFRELNLHRQYVVLYENSPRGRRVFSLVGFKEEGRLRQAHYADGRYFDVLIWGLLAPEYYEAAKAAAASPTLTAAE
jgi:RimJ/RimL family protein N-acetyltransferase